LVSKIVSTAKADTLSEIELIFSDKDKKRKTKLVFGGLNLKQLPRLNENETNEGYMTSMGFGNHPFYESYAQHQTLKCISNPYYGFLTNEKDEWLDSHKIGIDGPMLYIDAANEDVLHLWLLSFERHALVGHYKIQF
jgi:hypothetical protein